jgi:hypothetical protein
LKPIIISSISGIVDRALTHKFFPFVFDKPKDTISLFNFSFDLISTQDLNPITMSGTIEDEDDDHSQAASEDHSKGGSRNSSSKASAEDKLFFSHGRLFVMALVIMLGAAAGAATFIYTSKNQEDRFESKVRERRRDTTGKRYEHRLIGHFID